MGESDSKIALVTGGARGIGAAVCRALAQRGLHVIATYQHSEVQAKQLCDELEAQGYSCSRARVDVREPMPVRELLRSIRKEHGRLDVVVNNAGIVEEKLFFFTKIERFWEVMQVNLGGVVNVSKAAIPLLGKRKSGRMINISSIAAGLGTMGLSAYASSKAAIESLTKVLARELASSGVRVNAVAPGFVQTDMTDGVSDAALRDQAVAAQPLPRIGRASEVAGLVAYLALDAPDYLTGEIIRLDGGAAIG